MNNSRSEFECSGLEVGLHLEGRRLITDLCLGEESKERGTSARKGNPLLPASRLGLRCRESCNRRRDFPGGTSKARSARERKESVMDRALAVIGTN